MHEQQRLLEAIRASPEDDVLRLAFADWLEENGKLCWAGVVREQMRRLRRDPDGLDEGWAAGKWQTFAASLWAQPLDLERLRTEMGYPVPFEAQGLERGLVGRLALDTVEFLALGPALVAWGPVPALHLRNVNPHLEALARCEALAGVEALSLVGNRLDDEVLRVLLGSPHFGRLQELNFSRAAMPSEPLERYSLTGAGARLLADCTTLPSLKRLCLDRHPLGDDGLQALNSGQALRGLTALSLEWCRVTGVGFAGWVGSIPWPELRHLNLFGNRLVSVAAELFAASPQLSTLHSLRIPGTNFTDRAAGELGRSPYPTRLHDLDLSMNSVEDNGFSALASSPALAELRRLQMRWSAGSAEQGPRPRIGPRGGAALRNAPFAGRLRILDLSSHLIGDAGLIALAESGGYGNLERLDVGGNEIGDAGVEALTRADQLQKLAHLSLGTNRIGPAGARALARWPLLPRLQWASLGHNPFGPDAVDVMLHRIQAELARDTLRLDLYEMNIGDEGIARLTARPELARCDRLQLMRNGITARGARLLAECPRVNRLLELELGLNPIGDEGTVALAGSPHLARLRELNLGAGGLSDAGVLALVDSPHLTGLRELFVSGNTLTDAAAQALLRARWPDLEHLHLSRRGLSAEVQQALQERFAEKLLWY
jgi:uncharacterized protein (TIGR02996 family)